MKALAWSRAYTGIILSSISGLGSLKRGPVLEVFYRQIYFSGIQALGSVALIGGILGLVVTTQIYSISGVSTTQIGEIFAWVLIREVGPLFAAIVVIARSSTAIASELGSMKANREIAYLKSMGIPPDTYLIMPRVVGLTISLFFLCFYFQAVTLLGGAALASLVMDVHLELQFRGIMEVLEISELVMSFVKSVAFGLVISAASCYHGMTVRSSITEVPQVTTRAVMQSLVLVVFMDAVITGLWAL